MTMIIIDPSKLPPSRFRKVISIVMIVILGIAMLGVLAFGVYMFLSVFLTSYTPQFIEKYCS